MLALPPAKSYGKLNVLATIRTSTAYISRAFFHETIPTAGLTTQESKSQIAIRIKVPFVLFRSVFTVGFPGCKANAGTVTPKGPRTDFAKENTGNARLRPSG